MHIHTLLVFSTVRVEGQNYCTLSVRLSVRLYVSTWNRKIVYDHELISCSKVVHYEGLMQTKYCFMKTSIWPKGGHFDYICSIFLFLATYNWKVFSLVNDIVEPRGLSVLCVSFG